MLVKCERQLIDEAHRLNRNGKMLAPIIDDAHYMLIECLRKLRLLLEDLYGIPTKIWYY